MTYTRVLFVLVLAGCGAAHPASVDSGVGPSDASVADGGAPSEHCTDLCEARRTDPTSGGCPFETIPESGLCEDRCAEVSTMSEATRSAFDGCVREDPLCFQSIDQCVYSSRYPEPLPVPTTVSADGFAAHDGRSVIIAIQSGAELFRREVVIAAGSFEVRFEDPLPAAWPPSVLGFVDVDGDGVCDRGTDVPFYEALAHAGTFDAPAYRAHLVGPPDRDLGFVCDEL